jgi:hypothetical protein
MNGPPPYWLVWCEDGGVPRFKHESQHAAECEAQRLAENNPGRSFTVLAPASRFSVRRVNVERFDPEIEIPF